jgi:hypothetical protein
MLKTVTATDSTMAFWSSTETGSISAQIFGFLGTSIGLLVSSFQKRQLFRAGDFLTSHHGLTRCRLGYVQLFR